MTGQQLLEKLQSLTPEELGLKVYKYCSNYEEGEMLGPRDIRVIERDNAPYEKGCDPFGAGDEAFYLPEGTKLLYI